MGEYNKLFLSYIFLIFFNYSLQQILIPFNPFHSRNDEDGPTVVSKETFTVTSRDGSPITVTRIGIRRGKNINSGQRQTPLDLMRLMDDRISSIFEEIIRERIGLNLIMQRPKIEEEAKKENKDENNNNKDENDKKDEKDDKEFELDENKDDNKNKKENKTQENVNKNETNKEEGKVQENKTTQDNSNKDDKNVNNNNKETEVKNDKKNGNKKKGIGKLKINPEALKPKRRPKKKLSRKEVIFSRVCKYIFYSIILFTIYGLVKKLLELLEIIDPETNLGLKNVKADNEEEIKKKNNDIILNKQKENKQY
jgi:ABC-type antimicrobial peptide transport system permease subunit